MTFVLKTNRSPRIAENEKSYLNSSTTTMFIFRASFWSVALPAVIRVAAEMPLPIELPAENVTSPLESLEVPQLGVAGGQSLLGLFERQSRRSPCSDKRWHGN